MKKVAHLEDSIDNEDAYFRRDMIILSRFSVRDVIVGEICYNFVIDVTYTFAIFIKYKYNFVNI